MDESTLWAVAIGIGLFGLVLLAVGVLAAVYWSAATNEAREASSTGKPRSQEKDAPGAGKPKSQAREVASTGESHPRTPSPGVRQPAGGGFLAWVKAWIFAFVHASTVSLVLGGITFFEDMARANDEIQRTGTVSFPKQLLPGTLTSSAVRKRLSQPHGGLLETGEANETSEEPQHAAESSDAVEWEVLDVLDEAYGDGDA